MQYNNNDENEIHHGKRDESFSNMIRSILTKSGIQEKYMGKLLDDEALSLYDQGFTSGTANPDVNYEMYEQLGDVTTNKFIVWYMYNRFPVLKTPLGVKVVARLRINYGDRQTLSEIGDKLGFWNFITASVDERNHKKKDLLEDCVESFVGVTEFLLDTRFRNGVGYALVYDILTNIFNDIHISLKYEDLYDAKTRVKELFDFYSRDTALDTGSLKFRNATWVFIDTRDDKLSTSSMYFAPSKNQKNPIDNRPRADWVHLGTGSAALKKDSQQAAAQQALVYLTRIGYTKPVPPEYKLFSA